ncbi:MAG TPA: glycosyltransferase [Bryobacteraceae bacterium]|nr:glycosyltransferase [Bryobacteraceae bacterium]
MLRKRVLIGHPFVHPVGGGNAVAAWAIQALCRDYDVTLATLGRVNAEAVDRSFGTSLAACEFELLIAPSRYQRILRAKDVLRTPGALLEAALTAGWTRRLDRERRFDALLYTQNEADLGRPGLQYIHYPALYLPRPEIEIRPRHRIPGLLWLYRRGCFPRPSVSGARIRANQSLVNSEFVADRTRRVLGGNPILLHPPVPGEFPDTPWGKRRNAIMGIGRIAEFKRWRMAVGIVERVRLAGHELTLTIAGHPDDPREVEVLQKLAASRPWFRLLTNLSRRELEAEAADHRYGIHAMEDEHFGIAVAELQRAGCITFVHNSGGPVEIVGRDPRQTFDSPEDAVHRISQVLCNEQLANELRSLTLSRREHFSAERFCESLRAIVAQFIEDHP